MYAHFLLSSALSIEPFYSYKTEGSAEYARTMKLNRHWTGLRIFDNNLYHALFDLSLVNEFGHENDKPIRAFGLFAKAGYQFQFIPSKPIISIRESYASGGKKSDNMIHAFDPTYGAGDKYYGWMNITTWTNLDDREIVFECFPVKGMWVEMKYNRFYIPVPDDVKLLNTMVLIRGKHLLGDEFDIFIRYQLKKQWQLTGALGYFFPGDLAPINDKSTENAFWAAFQVLFTLHNNN
jgi:hypothetical protein